MTDERSPQILVVEDDPGSVILQRRRLERAGFRVQVATEVHAAMEVLERGGIDLVVMDYRLGSTTGLELHRQMTAAGFDVPVIIVSGSTNDAIVVEAMRAGIRDVVVKDTDYLEYLPDAARGILQQASAVAELRSRDHRRSRVMIVEDDVGTAALERRQLERAGYEAVVATAAEDARALVRDGSVAVAVLDLRLNDGISGLELYEQLKADGWHIPAILVTAFPDEAVAIRALRAGVRDFLPKSPDFLEHLAGAVDRVAAQARLERKLIESELRLASIIGTTMDSIVMCDEASHVVLFNRSAEEMFGLPATEALGRPIGAFIPQLRLGGLPAAPAADVSAGSVRQRAEVDGIRLDGTALPIEVSVSDVIVHGRRLFTVIARDISERRRIEAELREADRRKDEFLGMLAHELRNPLAAITTATEVLDRTVTDPQAARITSVVKRQTRTLARMVDDLLDVSRVTQGKIRLTMKPVLLSEVASRAADGVRGAAETSGLRFEVAIADEAIWLIADATRLEQVLTNLLSNAIKFTAPGGRVTLQAGREGSEAVLRVRDTGIGMSAELVPRVFDLFVQGDTSLDRSKSGLGIGLALVRQLVTLHGGRVAASSPGPGHGSEFAVHLPTATAGAVSIERHADAATVVRPVRVLVVDDHRDVADALALLIGTLGHRARAVYDGPSALSAARADTPDVMLVDIGMPGMTGYELARAVRSEPPLARVRLVALTGYGRDEDRARVLEAGFDLHLTKPVTDSKLQAVLGSFEPDGRSQEPPVAHGGS